MSFTFEELRQQIEEWLDNMEKGEESPSVHDTDRAKSALELKGWSWCVP